MDPAQQASVLREAAGRMQETVAVLNWLAQLLENGASERASSERVHNPDWPNRTFRHESGWSCTIDTKSYSGIALVVTAPTDAQADVLRDLAGERAPGVIARPNQAVFMVGRTSDQLA
jgi:hypothetical protein